MLDFLMNFNFDNSILTRSLNTVDRITISSNPFDHVQMLAWSPHGVWTSIKGSSVLELWDVEQFTSKVLFDVRFNRIVPRKGVRKLKIKSNMHLIFFSNKILFGYEIVGKCQGSTCHFGL